jgi:hypothetical protein
MKNIILASILILMGSQIMAQKFMTKNGYIKFYSETPMETIEAENQQVNSAYDHNSGAFVFKVLIKSFEFEKALMQEHFNENYMESDEFPVAIFKGKIINNEEIDLSKTGPIKVKVKGTIKIHGVSQELETDGLMDIQGEEIHATSKFIAKPADFNIKIPGAVIDNIAEGIEVTVDVKLKKMNK